MIEDVKQFLLDNSVEEDGPLPTKCRVWTGLISVGGYGFFRHEGRQWPTHRAAWETWVGPIPEGKYILHHCDQRACINIDHLYCGTQADNMRDMEMRGRKVVSTDFTNGQILEIRILAAQGQRIPRIAKRFDVNPETIRHIVRGTTYKEIGGPRTFGEAYISQFVGVTYNKANGKWKAYVRLNGKPKHIGYFATEIEAARAYNAAVIERGLDYPINEIGTEEI